MAGKKGCSGRKSLAFVQWCEARVNGSVRTKIERYLAAHGPADPTWMRIVERMWDYAYGKPAQVVQHGNIPGQPMEVTLTDARREFEGRMARLAERLGTAAMPEWPER